MNRSEKIRMLHEPSDSHDEPVVYIQNASGEEVPLRSVLFYGALEMTCWVVIATLLVVGVTTWGMSSWWLIAVGYAAAQAMSAASCFVDLLAMQRRALRRVAGVR